MIPVGLKPLSSRPGRSHSDFPEAEKLKPVSSLTLNSPSLLVKQGQPRALDREKRARSDPHLGILPCGPPHSLW